MTAEEFKYAHQLNDQGVEVFAQVTPTAESLNYSGIAKAFNK